jgi:hypothetical protein
MEVRWFAFKNAISEVKIFPGVEAYCDMRAWKYGWGPIAASVFISTLDKGEGLASYFDRLRNVIFFVGIFLYLYSFPRPDGFLISFTTYGRTPWTNDQPVARPLPARDNTT